MAEEDNFDDLDIYGDGTGEDYQDPQENAPAEASNAPDTRSSTLDNTYEQADHAAEDDAQAHTYDGTAEQPSAAAAPDAEPSAPDQQASTQAIASTSGVAAHTGPPKQAPVQQGVKRKEGSADERDVAPGATSALLISDLHWYQDEDDVRGWCNQSGVEDEVKEITFNEHKVNGKSKGQVFVALQTPQAATALKQKVESFSGATAGGPASAGRKHTATFHPPNNPYKTLPKENPNRQGQGRGNFQGGRGNFGNRGGAGAGGGGGGFNNRGGMNQSNFNQNRNFGGQGMATGGFNNNNNMGSGFNNNNMGMAGFNNNFRGGMGMGGMNRGGGSGGMMNRGGRGGMNMGMGGMGMGGMGGMGGGMMGGGMMGGPMGGMNMGMGGMGMGGGFGGAQQPHFNPAFFNNQQQGGMGGAAGGDWNNHPNKRQRQE